MSDDPNPGLTAIKQVAADCSMEADGFAMELACPEWTILNELKAPKITQRSVAMTYRLAMEAERRSGERIDWRAVNEAIVARWSRAGLERIKELAWSGRCFDSATAEKGT
jgi:hypothetical protein